MAPVSEEYAAATPPSKDGSGNPNANTILFDATKNELFRLNESYRTLQRKLKGRWRVASGREDGNINTEMLAACRVFVIAGPRDK
jgi:intraflagellar transport protein 52